VRVPRSFRRMPVRERRLFVSWPRSWTVTSPGARMSRTERLTTDLWFRLDSLLAGVARDGIEPSTFRFSGGRSYRLSYLALRSHRSKRRLTRNRPRSPEGGSLYPTVLPAGDSADHLATTVLVPYPDLGDDDEVGVENAQNQSAGVQSFNTRPEPEVRALLSTCLAAPRWVEEVAASRPYAGEDAVLAQADASAQSLTEQEVAAAIAHHPRIGERPSAVDMESRFSRREQSGVDGADSAMKRRLVERNAAYEDRFGRVFLIRAKGRDTQEILAELERRLGNDEETEHEEVVRQLREIAVQRLREVLHQ